MDLTQLSQQLKNPLVVIWNDIVALLPHIAGAILLLLIGWLVAYLVRLGSSKLLGMVNQFVERMLSVYTPTVAKLVNGVTQFLPAAFFWLTLFVFTIAALRAAGLSGMAASLEGIIDYLPSILAGALIILAGYVLGSLVKNIVLASLNSADIAEAEVLSRIAQTVTFVTAFIIGLDQIGIEVTFLTTMIGVSTAAVLIGFALAFGMGSRSLVSNLVAIYYIKDMIQTGQRVRIGEIEGTVLELSTTAVILDTADGRTSVPAKQCQEEVVTVLMEDHHHDA